jgi:formate/nitrite transporter FocA (FNT family)
MSSDPTRTGDAPKSYESILAQQIDSAVGEFQRSSEGLFLSALSAGLDLGFGPLLIAAMVTLTSGVYSEPLIEILTANMYTVGFIFVVLGRTELFTEHTTLAVLPVLDRLASIRDLGRLWGIVYAGNVVGGTIFAGVMVAIGPAFGIFEVGALGTITKPFVTHDSGALFGGAILAGWLMGLLSWLVIAARDTISRVFFVWLITFVIGFAHLPHSIAGNIEMLAALLGTGTVGPLAYVRFLVIVTIGNAIGGIVFVALLKYGHIVRESEGAGTSIGSND